MLTNLGIKSIYESVDGIAALEAIRTINPDVMILEWDLPVLAPIAPRAISWSDLLERSFGDRDR
jgi:AmiR/NasT family two-component response regulator